MSFEPAIATARNAAFAGRARAAAVRGNNNNRNNASLLRADD